MNSRIVVGSMLAGFLLLFGVQHFGQESSSNVLNPYNPPAFQKYAAPVSARIAFLASEQGKQTLLHAPNPIAKKFLERYWGKEVAAQWDQIPHKYMTAGPPSPAPFHPQGGAPISLAAVTRCPQTRFNLEPAAKALPQNEESIAFKFQGSNAADMALEVANDFRGFFLNSAVWSPASRVTITQIQRVVLQGSKAARLPSRTRFPAGTT